MKEMSLEELGMEVDEVENRAREMMEMMETCDSADDHSDYQEVKYENMVVENTEVSTEDVHKIAYNNMRIQDLAQIGQENIQKSKIEITPLMTIPKVEMKPTFKNVFYPAWYPDNILLPLPGQTGFHNRGLSGGGKRKYDAIRDEMGPNDSNCREKSGPGNYKKIRISLF